MAFTEILKIKPVLDAGTANQMEQNLSARFAKVAQRFGSGLKAVIKGSVLGITLGLLNRLLNPIEALDEKIKSLLASGEDIQDLSGRFGTSGGKLKQAEDVAKSLGVTPDKFREALTKFTEAVEKAEIELTNPNVEKSASSLILAKFAGQQDRLQAFLDFQKSLKGVEGGDGTTQALTQRAAKIISDAQAEKRTLSDDEKKDLLSKGEIRNLTGIQTRQTFEKEVFGAAQFGSAKRFADTDFGAQAKTIRETDTDKIGAAVRKLSDLEAQKRVFDVINQNQDFLAASGKLNESMIASLAKSEAREEAEKTKRLGSYESLKQGADAVEDIKEGLGNLLESVSQGLGQLKTITEFIPKITSSSWWKGIVNLRGKKE